MLKLVQNKTRIIEDLTVYTSCWRLSQAAAYIIRGLFSPV